MPPTAGRTITKTPHAAGRDVGPALTRHVRQLVRLDTSNPPGNESLVTDYVAHELDQIGIEYETFEAAPGRANLVARLRGAGEQAPVMLIAHADVVGATPEGWDHPPFAGELIDGEVWGRGTLDMKGHIATHMVVLETLKRSRTRLRGDVVLLITCDEEAGSRLGAHWLWEHHHHLFDAQVAFNEGGGQRFTTPGGPVYTAQVAEKGIARIRIHARGTGGHASIPRNDNAVLTLGRALARLADWRPDTVLTQGSHRLLAALARQHPGPIGDSITRCATDPSWDDLAALPIDPRLREFVLAGTHNTAVPTMLQASPRLNVTPHTAIATLDARLLPGQQPADWARRIQDVIGNDVQVELVRGRSGVESSISHSTLDAVDQVLGQLDPGAHLLPYISSASSDARALPGFPVLGFFPSRHGVDKMNLIHGTNERVRIDDLRFAHDFLTQITTTLLTPGD